MKKKKLKKKIIRLKALNKELKDHVSSLDFQIKNLLSDEFLNDHVRFYLKSMIDLNPDLTVHELIVFLDNQLGKE